MSEINFFGQSTTVLEIVAMITGIAGVYLTIRRSVWCFPVGIINVLLYAWLFFSPGVRLYADALLQCIYTFLLIYGWIQWSKVNMEEKIQPLRLSVSTLIQLILILITSSFLLSFFLIRYTNASYPVLDSILTCASLIAQWMIAKKFIENWIVWVVVDLAYLPLYLLKDLPFTALLYAIFMLMAVQGYREWKKSLLVT